MPKKQVIYILVLSILLSLLINVFFGRFIGAKISTWPLLNRWKIISPMAPIVINTREEVRVSDAEDVLKTISLTRPKLSGIVTAGGDGALLVGGAVNMTSDGLFLTAKAAMNGNKQENLYVKLDDGTLAKISSIVADPASNLLILKANANNAPVANISPSRNLSAGDRVMFLAPTLKNFTASFQNSFIIKNQASDYSAVLDSDLPRQTYEAQATGALLPGQAIVNMGGDIVGLWDGGSIVASDVIRDFVNSYLVNSGKLERPAFGFSFRNVSAVETKILNVPIGARITKTASAGPAQKAGLKEGDIITAINDTQLTEDNPLESFLQKYKPDDRVKFSVSRDKNKLDIYITATTLK